jgi:predicted dehydrogenase
MADAGWAELDPAFSYRGLRMRIAQRRADTPFEDVCDARLSDANQFALEIDHFARCVREGKRPHTPGEEGLADVRVMDAIYRSAREGKPVRLPAVAGLDVFRGPPPV